jgi:thioredoxin
MFPVMKFILPSLCALVLATSAFAVGTHLKGEKPLSISQGREVNLGEFLVPGRYTVFDFTSEYCAPCRSYDETLLALHRQRADVAVVKIDINRSEVHQIDWDSPVAKQYDLHSVPLFVVFGPNGALVAQDQPDNPAARLLVNKWISALP